MKLTGNLDKIIYFEKSSWEACKTIDDLCSFMDEGETLPATVISDLEKVWDRLGTALIKVSS